MGTENDKALPKDEFTIEEIVSAYARMVAKVAFTYVGSTAEAEDIAQEVFLKLLQKPPDFASAEHVKTWLIRVTVNQSKDFLRSSRCRRQRPLCDDLSYLPREENEVLKTILEMDLKYRIVLYLHYCEGYSIREMAQLLHKNASTIGSQLSRARNRLENDLKERGIDL